jgi:nitrogen fixation protein
MTCDIPNAIIQAYLPKKEPGEDMLVDINPELYGPAVVLENHKKVLYVEVLKAIYSMLEAALLYSTRHLKRTLKTLDLFSTHTTHAW